MKSLWNDVEAEECAARCAGEDRDVARCLYGARLLGGERRLVLHGGGNVSVKVPARTLFGEDETVLRVKGSGADLGTLEPAGLPALQHAPLLRLRELPRLDDDEMARALLRAKLDPTGREPSVEALLHAFLPHRFVDHTHADALLEISNQPDGAELVRTALGDGVAVIPWVRPGFALAKAALEAHARHAGCSAIAVCHHGLFTFADDARAARARAHDRAGRPRGAVRGQGRRQDAHDARGVAGRGGRAVGGGARGERAADRARCARGGARGTARARVAAGDRGVPRRPRAGGVLAARRRGGARAARTADARSRDPHQRRVPVPDARASDRRGGVPRRGGALRRRLHGVLRRAPRAHRAVSADAGPAPARGGGRRRRRARLRSGQARGGDRRGHRRADAAGDRARERARHLCAARTRARVRDGVLAARAGEAAGGAAAGARGTDRAGDRSRRRDRYGIAGALLDAGAHLVLTDLSEPRLSAVHAELLRAHAAERIATIAADVTSATDMARVFALCRRAFGGVDILVPNAGIAHVARLADLQPDDLRRVMDVNVTGTANVLKLATKVFAEQGTGGSVIIQSSKNVFDPGAGFGAYSASKAAVHQLGKIAALELAPLGVRVNMINADAVFGDDVIKSGLWEQIGDDRMRARGLDPEGLRAYYRDRSLLKVSVLPAHVGQAVVFFAAATTPTTGATLPVDAGIPGAFPR